VTDKPKTEIEFLKEMFPAECPRDKHEDCRYCGWNKFDVNVPQTNKIGRLWRRGRERIAELEAQPSEESALALLREINQRQHCDVVMIEKIQDFLAGKSDPLADKDREIAELRERYDKVSELYEQHRSALIKAFPADNPQWTMGTNPMQWADCIRGERRQLRERCEHLGAKKAGLNRRLAQAETEHKKKIEQYANWCGRAIKDIEKLKAELADAKLKEASDE
jgi:DNA repair exonuclease SbcCD ATPase subunit